MVVLISASTRQELIKLVREKLELSLNGSLQRKINIALSGGSSGLIIADAFLSLDMKKYDIKNCYFYFADERYVPLTDKDSNYKLISDCLFTKLQIPKENIFTINFKMDLSKCANEYSDKINTQIMRKNSIGVPIFDLIVLGMGPDCHICSLFSDSPLLNNYDDQINSKLWVASISNSPKPPSNRITLTMPILDACERVFVIAYGDEKLEALQRCFNNIIKPKLPASILCRNDMFLDDSLKRITWFVDLNAKTKIEALLKTTI